MNWKQVVICICCLLLLVSAVSPQEQGRNRGNRRNQRRNRPNRRGNRGNAGSRQSRPGGRPGGRPGRRPGGRPGGRPSRVNPTPGPTSNSTRCELIQVPMCKGMTGYRYTRFPNQFGHTNQLQAYRALEYMWAFMDIGCALDFRTTACGYYLPKCTEGQREVQLPCKETCNLARKCKKRMRQLQSRWPNQFQCRQLPGISGGSCIQPLPPRPSCQQQHLTCERNAIPMCQNLTFAYGSLPNMFLQCNVEEIQTELQQFQELLDSNCSPHLRFFMCGIYMPYCVRAETPFALPCREICNEVRQGCERVYRRLTNGLPWPSKFQCHRYPRSTNEQQVCASPADVSLRMAGTDIAEIEN